MPSYSPKWAPHVVGTFPERTLDEDGVPEPQVIIMKCSHPMCGAEWRHTCTSGAVRQHIQNFALAHAHRDAMKKPIERT